MNTSAFPSSIRWKSITLLGLVALAALVGLGFLTFTPEPNLTERLQEARATLERARTEHIIDYNVRETALLLPDVEQPEARKILFIVKMLPLIAEENERIRAQRTLLKNDPTPAQINALAIAYGVKPGRVNRTELLKRIDVLPESLVLAQAAIESAWGTSRFAREGHAYFGERTYDPNVPGITPKRATGFKVRSFATPALSVRAYMRALNTHRAYRTLRAHRATQRAQGQHPSGLELAAHLGRYSEIGQSYITRITATITANQLGDFDGIVHVEY